VEHCSCGYGFRVEIEVCYDTIICACAVLLRRRSCGHGAPKLLHAPARRRRDNFTSSPAVLFFATIINDSRSDPTTSRIGHGKLPRPHC